MDQSLIKQYMTHFAKNVRRSVPSGPVLLLLDQHSSRLDPEWAKVATEHQISVITLPANLQHIPQP